MNRKELFLDLFNNTEVRKRIVVWVSYWFLIMGTFIYVLKPAGFNYRDSFLAASIYFFMAGSIGLYFFLPRNSLEFFKDSKTQFALILLSLPIFILLGVSIKSFTVLSKDLAGWLEYLQLYFPFFEIGTTLSKFIDIYFQQAMILSLVLFLKEKSSSKIVCISIFTIVFFVLHFPLIINFGWMGFAFIIPSLFAGGIFSYLILTSSFGLFYSFLVHEFFYLALGLLLRMIW